jgi:hypothetical protein
MKDDNYALTWEPPEKKLRARIAHLEKALQNICRHQKIIAGGVYQQTGAWRIANDALNKEPS